VKTRDTVYLFEPSDDVNPPAAAGDVVTKGVVVDVNVKITVALPPQLPEVYVTPLKYIAAGSVSCTVLPVTKEHVDPLDLTIRL
jgi:hypothetical protein